MRGGGAKHARGDGRRRFFAKRALWKFPATAGRGRLFKGTRSQLKRPNNAVKADQSFSSRVFSGQERGPDHETRFHRARAPVPAPRDSPIGPALHNSTSYRPLLWKAERPLQNHRTVPRRAPEKAWTGLFCRFPTPPWNERRSWRAGDAGTLRRAALGSTDRADRSAERRQWPTAIMPAPLPSKRQMPPLSTARHTACSHASRPAAVASVEWLLLVVPVACRPCRVTTSGARARCCFGIHCHIARPRRLTRRPSLVITP